MTDPLGKVMCNRGLTRGFAEVRRFINGRAITINGELATEWDQKVHQGDIIKLGKRKMVIV